MKSSTLIFLASLFAPQGALAQVAGQPFGFAAGVTGGGNAVPAVPSSIEQCVPDTYKAKGC